MFSLYLAIDKIYYGLFVGLPDGLLRLYWLIKETTRGSL